jgi:hypothetical protein
VNSQSPDTQLTECILSHVHGEDIKGVCEKCGIPFKVSSPDYEEAKVELEAEFEKHKCQREEPAKVSK